MTALPTYDQVSELPILAKGTVPPEFIDMNGHMNIKHYMELGAASTSAKCDEAGVNDAYIAERGLGIFTAEHHLRYLGELREGESYTAHARVLERSDKAVYIMSFLLDQERRRLSNTFETFLIHVDMTTRRPTPFPQDVAARIDAFLEEDRLLPWPAPRCGVMGIRH